MRQWEYDCVMSMYLGKCSEEQKEKIKKHYEGGKMYDIYVDYSIDPPAILAIERLNQETYDKVKGKKDFMEQRKKIDYYCQYPHRNWRDAIEEYRTWACTCEKYNPERFSKTHCLPPYDFSFMSPTIREKIEKIRKKQTYPLHLFLFQVSMFNLVMTAVDS